MESKIEIELTEKEASHLRTLLEGGIKISDSISQGEVFENILDHLNSQDQEEVKNPEYDGIREVERQKFKNIVDTVNKRYPQDTPEEITAEQLCEDNRKRMERLINKEMEERGFIRKIKDTPEQKEEWEFDLRNLMYRDGEQLRCAGEGKPYTGEYRELVVSMIKNLLSEREREAREEGFREGADIVESDYIRKVKKLEKRLSKLTTK